MEATRKSCIRITKKRHILSAFFLYLSNGIKNTRTMGEYRVFLCIYRSSYRILSCVSPLFFITASTMVRRAANSNPATGHTIQVVPQFSVRKLQSR